MKDTNLPAQTITRAAVGGVADILVVVKSAAVYYDPMGIVVAVGATFSHNHARTTKRRLARMNRFWARPPFPPCMNGAASDSARLLFFFKKQDILETLLLR